MQLFIIATVGIILFVMNSMEGESLVTSDLVEMVRNGEIVGVREIPTTTP